MRRVTEPAAAARIARRFPSFRDFVDDALFHPDWGYYSAGHVRFGEGGHFDTYPLALAPLFGRMLSRYAYRFWRRAGRPRPFEICELGAGNGQLCLDVLSSLDACARHDPTWKRFAAALRYRIIDRSPALIARQRQLLGPLARRVRWSDADLARRPARSAPFAAHGLVFANEVLDCLAHHKIVPHTDGEPGVVFVVPALGTPAGAQSRSTKGTLPLGAVPRRALGRVLNDERRRPRLRFEEIVLPLRVVPGLRPFLRRHHPEIFSCNGDRLPPERELFPCFACPAIETLIRNSSRLYRSSEALWIDYGHARPFHLHAPESQRVFAGPPRSGATVYRNPGREDITFMVDFSVVAAAAERAGCEVVFYGGQGKLARRSGVRLDHRAREVVLRQRALAWLLAVVGVGPEHGWRQTGLTWNPRAARGGFLSDDVQQSLDEFVGKRPTAFKLMILRRAG